MKKGVTYKLEIDDPNDYPTDVYVICLTNTGKSLGGGSNKKKLNIAIGGAACDSFKVSLYTSKGKLITSKIRNYKDGYLNWV